jgi:hypothetical protein
MERVCKRLRCFFSSQDGLVTVEWVALASALVLGAIAIAYIVINGLKGPASAIGSSFNVVSS